MLAEKRRENILKEIHLNGSVKVSYLSHRFNVTEETIRKDLEKLDNQGAIKRIHGGAITITHFPRELSFNVRQETNIEEKKIIAKKAAMIIEPGSSLFLDASTTSLFLAKELSNLQDLTIITNSIIVVYELATNVHVSVLSTGGYLRPNSLSFVGSLTNETIKKYNADYFFASCSGISVQSGATETNEFETEVKANMVKQAAQTMILADNTKFNKSSLKKFADLSDITSIISDDTIEQEIKDEFKKKNIPIV